MKLDKSNTLSGISLEQILKATSWSCDELIQALQDKLDVKLKSSCKIIEIKHKRYLKTVIHNRTSIINVYDNECSDDKLQFASEPVEVEAFSYGQLKEKANLIGTTYHGIFLGSIKNHQCPKTIDCPECNGTGICPSCDGTKKVTCPVCEGELKCVSCDGTGKYTCTNCEGSGNCPECDDGWETCGYCYGSGTISCPDCGGSGNYIDDTCNKCGGSGYYDYYSNKVCRTCNGTGRFIIKCKRCDGDGEIECDNCDGEGGWDCEECHGTGKCSHCHGKGEFTCKACKGSGVCGKCKGRGEIWCPDCQGKGICWNCAGKKIVQCPRCEGTGIYQTYRKYTITEEESIKKYMYYPFEKEDVEILEGEKIYDGVIYDFYAKRCNIYNVDDAKKTVIQFGEETVKAFEQWTSLTENSRFEDDKIFDDFINIRIENFSVPVTEVVYSCRNTDYSVFIIGDNKIIWYDKLPSSWKQFWGGIF